MKLLKYLLINLFICFSSFLKTNAFDVIGGRDGDLTKTNQIFKVNSNLHNLDTLLKIYK